ncbi:hypothetical protein [Sphingobium cloacae]|uniref:hypothetical protein n=1 Tax=Sphingobium cloacae TaxID=120107 RepID=UPI001473C412|nr:hypothetical protein [Sphingobium cloacae]
MIHLTLIIVDFLTGLLAAGAWALASAGGAIAALVGEDLSACRFSADGGNGVRAGYPFTS